MIDEMIAHRLVGRTQQRGKRIEAVGSGVVGQCLICGSSESGNHIDMADQLIGYSRGFDLARPARDKGNAMPAFE